MSPLAVAPTWVAAALLPILLLGLAGWAAEIGRRIATVVVVYMAAYSIVGIPVDLFWGAMTTPLLMFGLIWAIPALRDLARSSGLISAARMTNPMPHEAGALADSANAAQ